MTGLDVALQKFPQLDADRQYIAGGSYGGFMTTWAIGHTKRFAAAIAQRPVTNWISLFGTSDIGFYFNPEELGTDLFAEGGVASYWRQSPLAYAQQVTTPFGYYTASGICAVPSVSRRNTLPPLNAMAWMLT